MAGVKEVRGLRGLINKIKAKGAMALIVQRKVTDPEVVDFRKKRCYECPNYNPNEDKCMICKCIIEAKSQSLTNLKLDPDKGLFIEITHCPIAQWNDQEIVDLYKKDVDS